MSSLFWVLTTSFLIVQDIAALNKKAPDNTTQQTAPIFKYTGYWFVKLGDEFIREDEENHFTLGYPTDNE